MLEERRQATTARQAALLRAARVKRWVTGGALALTGILSAVAAHALPASHAASHSAATTATTPAAPTGADQTAGQSSSGLSPPAEAPQTSSSGSGAVSGGS